MTVNSLDWYALSRESAPGVLLGVEATTGPIERETRSPSTQAADFMVGIEVLSSPKGSIIPCVALAADNHIAELFAWLHTYSTESFPISQFCRIETIEYWDSLLKLNGMAEEFPSAIWASIIAGEMLANAEQGLDLRTVPLSWASNCFSYTMARVFRVAGRESSATADATARLRVVETDSRFTRRKLSVDVLSPMWMIVASGELIEGGDLRNIVDVVLSALDHEGSTLLRKNDKLVSSSAEQRIHGFDEFVDTMLASRWHSRLNMPRVGALLAGAALLAGGGTSHIDLLKPHVDEYPDCLPWFGLLAGFAGPKAWDSDWLRLVKGIERQIRSGFRLTDPLQSDLCWMEFDWLRRISKSPSIFSDLLKYHNRLLTVEIFPGATYQARLAVQASDLRAPPSLGPESGTTKPSHGDTRRVETTAKSDDYLAQLRGISDQLQVILGRLTDGNLAASRNRQASLFEDVAPKKSTKRSGSRTKKGTSGA